MAGHHPQTQYASQNGECCVSSMPTSVRMPHILVVDDDLLLWRIIALNLVRHGSSVAEMEALKRSV